MIISNLNILSFRRLQNISLQELKRVNYIVGENNCGKTSVLEAVIAGGGYSDINLFTDTVYARNQKGFFDAAKNMLIPKGKESSIISIEQATDQSIRTEIKCTQDEKIQQSDKGIQNIKLITVKIESEESFANSKKNETFWVNFEQNGNKTTIRKDPKLSQRKNGRFPCQFVSFSRYDRTSNIIKALDDVFKTNQRDILIRVLQFFDAKATNFEVVGEDRQILVFRNGESEEEALFLNDYGNGMYKAFYIACAAILAENGVLLIDELEAGIHHKALEKIVRFLEDISIEKNIQIFVTTHSLELLDVARRHHEEDSFAVYNLGIQTNGAVVINRMDNKELKLLREDLGLDIR
ncbi:MAG: AAA family ATPase [Lachnospiraceae bacterium]|nr:AAA family ATPase [Lachnospiraceae bacterium]